MDAGSFQTTTIQFIQNTTGLYVGWPMSGPVHQWWLYNVEWGNGVMRNQKNHLAPTRMERVRPLTHQEVQQLHQHHIMYWGEQMHPHPKGDETVSADQLVTDALVICRPSDFAPRYFAPTEASNTLNGVRV